MKRRGVLDRVALQRAERRLCRPCSQKYSRSKNIAITDGVLPRHLAPWNPVPAIGDGCLAAGGTYCRSCGDACPEGAIRFAVQLGGIAIAGISDTDRTGCGACVSTCPVGAARVAAPARSASARTER
ncbi:MULTISPECIES: 4Fe-4S dicluster domain-containing protein [Tistrella]|uniref:4Fe-4S dicluster domain-containing protein n=1 Tax=Tistrella TaxID=171436 RepID=UPI0031F6382B